MKKSMQNIAFAMFLVITGSLALFAQDPPGKRPPVTPSSDMLAKRAALAKMAPNMSKVPAPVQNLMKFMGRWVGDIAVVTDGKTNKVEYHLVGRGTAGGYGIYLDESFRDSTLGDLKGSNLVGWDPNDEKIHWYSVDNQGTTHEHTGNWKGSDSLYLDHSSTRKGKAYKEKISLIFKGKEEIQFSLVATLDGKESEKATGVFVREKPPVRPGKPGVSPASAPGSAPAPAPADDKK